MGKGNFQILRTTTTLVEETKGFIENNPNLKRENPRCNDIASFVQANRKQLHEHRDNIEKSTPGVAKLTMPKYSALTAFCRFMEVNPCG